MGVDVSVIPLLSRRAIEAELALRLYVEALPRVGEAMAREILDAAIDRAALEAGRAFAAGAPDGPSLRHFAQVLDLWQAGGALSIENIRLGVDTLSFRVSRCGYLELYRELGIPQALHASLSCRRDAAFALGYSPRLQLDRPQVLSGGASACLFHFTWQD